MGRFCYILFTLILNGLSGSYVLILFVCVSAYRLGHWTSCKLKIGIIRTREVDTGEKICGKVISGQLSIKKMQPMLFYRKNLALFVSMFEIHTFCKSRLLMGVQNNLEGLTRV
jgi:hypothetical protein